MDPTVTFSAQANLIASSVTTPSLKTYLLTYWMCVVCSQSGFCPTVGVTLRSFKTDSFRLSQSLIIARTASQIYAVTAMQHYFHCAVPPSLPLFSFQFGRLLTRSAVISLPRDIVRLVGLPFHSLKGHTFRIGAASTAAAVGLPDWLIKIMGRWSSDCYQLYIGTTSLSAAFCGPKNGQRYSVNNALFCLQRAYVDFFKSFFAWGDTLFACICGG